MYVRAKPQEDQAPQRLCKWCSEPLPTQQGKGRPRLYCNRQCKHKYNWNHNYHYRQEHSYKKKEK